jgi:hypothetical protein
MVLVHCFLLEGTAFEEAGLLVLLLIRGVPIFSVSAV